MGSMLDQIGSVVTVPYELTWVSESFLQAQEVSPWTNLPSWIPGDPLMFVDVRDAVASGLTFRPLATTALDTIEWDKTRSAEDKGQSQFGISRERERELLDAWHAANA